MAKKGAFIVLGILFAAGLVLGLRRYAAEESFSPAEQGKAVIILMYHNITDKPAGSKYTITAEELEGDLNYIEEKGYTAVGINDLIAYANGEGDLPDKPIVLTFDDGYESVYTLGLPLFKRYGCKAVVGVIGELTELFSEEEDHNIEYSHLTWEEINEMSKSGFVEFQNHTYALHEIKNGRKGAAKKKGESLEEYKKLLSEDAEKLNEEILSYTGIKPAAFIYPYGNFDDDTETIIREAGFEAILNCYEKVNYIKAPEDLFKLCRFLRPSGKSSAEIFSKFEEQPKSTSAEEN